MFAIVRMDGVQPAITPLLLRLTGVGPPTGTVLDHGASGIGFPYGPAPAFHQNVVSDAGFTQLCFRRRRAVFGLGKLPP